MRMPEPERREQGEQIIPLINIVFLLLIFFMLAGTLSAPDPFDIDPPEARQGLSADEPQEGLLSISAAGGLAFEGDAIAMEVLADTVRTRLREDEMLRLTLKADAGVRATFLLDVMDALRNAGADSVLLLTSPES
ncbi:MAG: biopolymer transporter ExbD [Aquisalimonadaceae bacterium]